MQTHAHTHSHASHSQPLQRRPRRGNQRDRLLLGLRAKPLQQRLPRAEALLVAQTKDFAEHVLKLWPVLSQDVEGKREKLRRRDLALWARQTPNVSSVPAVQRRAKSETVSSLTQL